jgi:hypothetical protein
MGKEECRKVQGSGVWVQGIRCRVQDVRFKVLGFWIAKLEKADIE